MVLMTRCFYTLTNSLTGAGAGKYILPGRRLVGAGRGIWLASAVPRRRPSPGTILAIAFVAVVLALASVDASPAFRQISELVKSQSRDGDPDFCGLLQRTVEKRSPARN